MKMTKRVTLTLVLAMVVFAFAGCSKFDAGKYLQAQLDNSYKNDSSAIVEQKIDSKEAAEKVYNQGMDTQVSSFFAGTNVSDEIQTRYRDIFAEMFSKADYKIKDSKKQSDGSYEVTVEYRKMKIFAPVMEKLKKQAKNLDASDANDYMESFFTMMGDCLEEELSNGVEYEDAKTLTVHIEIKNRTYTVNQNDVQSLTEALFDSDAISAN